MSKEKIVYECEKCNTLYVLKSSADKCCTAESKVKQCEECGVGMCKKSYYTLCESCRKKKEDLKELERYSKATKYTFGTVPSEYVEYLYSPLYPYNEGYMFDLEDEYIKEYGIKYVYGTKRISPSYDAFNVAENMLEDTLEDWADKYDKSELSKLQIAIDDFVKNHNGGLDWFEVDYSVVIELDKVVEE